LGLGVSVNVGVAGLRVGVGVSIVGEIDGVGLTSVDVFARHPEIDAQPTTNTSAVIIDVFFISIPWLKKTIIMIIYHTFFNRNAY